VGNYSVYKGVRGVHRRGRTHYSDTNLKLVMVRVHFKFLHQLLVLQNVLESDKYGYSVETGSCPASYPGVLSTT